VLGALTAAAYTIAQSAGATRQLGTDFDRDDRVLLGVLAVALVGTILGLTLGLVVVLAGPVPRALAAAPLAVAVGSWVTALVVALRGVERSRQLLEWTPTAVGVLVGLALAGLGLRSVRRVVAWPIVLAVVAVAAASQTAFGYLASLLRPRSGLPSGLLDHLEATRDVFLQALPPGHQGWITYAVAVGVGVLGSAALWRRASAPTGPERSAGPVAVSASAAAAQPDPAGR
jgi:hypothetical protein